MPDPSFPGWAKHILILMAVLSIVLLGELLFYVPWRCGQVSAITGGEYACDLDIGWYCLTAVAAIIFTCSAWKLKQWYY